MFSFFPWMLGYLKLQLSWLKCPPKKLWRGGKYNIPAAVHYLQNTSSYSSWSLDWKCENSRSQKLFFSQFRTWLWTIDFDLVSPYKYWSLYQAGALSLVSEATDKRFIFSEWMLVSYSLFFKTRKEYIQDTNLSLYVPLLTFWKCYIWMLVSDVSEKYWFGLIN